MNTTIESEKNAATTEAPQAKGKPMPTKNAKATKKAARAKKAAGKTKEERTNKKAEVIALMKRTKGATLGRFDLLSALAAQDADEAPDRVRLPLRDGHNLRQRRALGALHQRLRQQRGQTPIPD
jgi:hypothetical protein